MADTSSLTTSADILAFVAQLKADKGDSAVQQLLQQTLQRNNKLSSENAIVKKKCDAERRAIEQAKEDSARLLARLKIIEDGCDAAHKEVDAWPAHRDKQVEGQQERIRRAKESVIADSDALAAKVDIMEAENLKQVETNKVLQDEFNSLKEEFEQEMRAHEEGWKERECKTEANADAFKATTEITDRLKAESTVYDRQTHELATRVEGNREQIAMYHNQFSDLEKSAMSRDDVQKITSQQQSVLQVQIDAVERDRKMDMDEKTRHDAEAKKVRERIQQLKKKVAASEKLKVAAEAKCRAAQNAKK